MYFIWSFIYLWLRPDANSSTLGFASSILSSTSPVVSTLLKKSNKTAIPSFINSPQCFLKTKLILQIQFVGIDQ